MTTLEIPQRLRGPGTSGNGSRSAGALAGRRPPPLGSPLMRHEADDRSAGLRILCGAVERVRVTIDGEDLA